MRATREDIRLALPSKGRLAEEALTLLAESGFRVHKPNPRQYQAEMPDLPGVTVLFQRAGDIVHSVRDGSVDFGITGRDMIAELGGTDGRILPLHTALGFGHCTLQVIVPEAMTGVHTMAGLRQWAAARPERLRVGTKFGRLTEQFFAEHGLPGVEIISAEGTLEIAPTIGYADVIVDLVSTGTTLRDNRLRMLQDGCILVSQACLIAHRPALRENGRVQHAAKQLIEYIVAHLRARENVAVVANIRGDSAEAIAAKMHQQSVIGGLQGPTISPVYTRDNGGWFAVHIIVHREHLAQAIAELRRIGGSGVVVTPVTYIFEEEPQEYRDMLAALDD